MCCAPCSIYTLKKLREEGADVYGYSFNPNIHPYTEFKKRLSTLQDYAKLTSLPLVVDKSYDLDTFLRGALDHGKIVVSSVTRCGWKRHSRRGLKTGLMW